MRAVMPYIDLAPVYNSWDQNNQYTTGNNGNIIRTTYPVYLCPSDSASRTWNNVPNYNYAVNLGNTTTTRTSPFNGINYMAAPFNTTTDGTRANVGSKNCKTTKMSDITDGTTNVMLIAEIRQGQNTAPSPAQDLRGLIWYVPFVGFTAHNPPNTFVPDRLQSTFCISTNSTIQLPCAGNDATNPIMFSARSRHTGGVHVLLGDGSARFISENIDLNTWRNLSTIADGQSLGEF